jgi:hypothetical protein
MNNIKFIRGFIASTVAVVVFQALPIHVEAAISIAWENTDESVVSTQIYRTTTGMLSAPDSRYLIVEASNTQTSYRDTNVVPGTQYYYTLFNLDENGNYSDPASVQIVNSGQIVTPPVDPALPPANSGARTQTLARINVRASASATAQVLRVVNVGSTGTIVGGPVTNGGITWIQVQYDGGVTGWSAKQYLTNVGDTAATTEFVSDPQKAELIRQIQAKLVTLIQQLLTLLQNQ